MLETCVCCDSAIVWRGWGLEASGEGETGVGRDGGYFSTKTVSMLGSCFA